MGAFNSFPRKFGAEQGHVEELLLLALLEADGTAMADDVGSFVWAEHLAEAHALAALHHLNQRMANQWDPVRMTEFVPRWERILNLFPLPTDTMVDRRKRIGAKQALFGQPPTQQVVQDLMSALLGPVFVQLVTSSSAEAVGWVGITPANAAYGYAGGGVTVPGGVTLPDGSALGITWYSTIAHIVVLTTQPATYSDQSYRSTVALIAQFLDDLLPCWATWDWVLDGSMPGEFILDDPHNLDNERLGT